MVCHEAIAVGQVSEIHVITTGSTSRLNAFINTGVIPPLPGVALEVVRRTRDAEPDMDKVAASAGRDPALAVRLLKLSNSSLFGRTRQVTTLRQAVMVLGLKNVQIAALSLSLMPASAVQHDDAVAPLYRAFRRRAVFSAVTARECALVQGGTYAEEAFLCGLLMDAGVALLLNARPDGWERVLASFTAGHPDTEVEREVLGFTHADLLACMLAQWGLADVITEPVRAHHEAEALSDRGPVARITRLLALAHEVSGAELAVGAAADAGRVRLANALGLDAEAAKTLHERIVRQASELATVMDLDIDAREEVAMQIAEAQEAMLTEHMAQGQDLRKAEALAGELRASANTDALTCIGNRLAFDTALLEQRPNGFLLMFDVDHFKLVNDRLGHPAGDAVLRQLGAVVREALPDGQPFRYGGEEFAVLLDGTGLSPLLAAERLRVRVEKTPAQYGSGMVSCTISIGAATFAEVGGDTQRQVSTADKRLYCAKRGGRNRSVVSDAPPAA